MANELSDLEKLGKYFLDNSPVQALEVLRKNILLEVEYYKENTFDKDEKVYLITKKKYSSGYGDTFDNIDFIFLSPSDKDKHKFWQTYIQDKEFSHDQKGGILITISDSTSVSIQKVVINGKNVLFVYPSSTFVNWKSTYTVIESMAVEFETKFIDDEDYKLATCVGVK